MGRWWDNPNLAKDLNLTADQTQKMNDIFQQSRLKLIDLHASLQKEEATLEPLINADTPDEGKVLAQIDRVAQARAELEKANARMLLSVRQVLTADQWAKLKAARAQRMPHGLHGQGPGAGMPPPN
jgi:periplasmic protein CpxP/Spy